MFCSKCGKEIADEAIICPMCGCATANYHTPAVNNTSYSQDYILIKEFEENVKSLHNISVIAMVLFLGIGIIFSLAAWIKAKSITVPVISTTHPNEISIFEAAKKKLNSALLLSMIPLYVLMICLTPALIYLNLGAGFLFLAVCAIFIVIFFSCTQHLNQALKKKQ